MSRSVSRPVACADSGAVMAGLLQCIAHMSTEMMNACLLGCEVHHPAVVWSAVAAYHSAGWIQPYC